MFQIRKAEIENKEAVQRIYAAAVDDQSTLDDQRLERLIKAKGLLIASTADAVVGFAGIDLGSQEQVQWIYCLPEYQGTGVGSRLLAHLEHIGWQAGLTTLRVHAAPGAVKFYLRRGYEVDQHAHRTHDHEGVEMLKHLPSTNDARGDVKTLEQRIEDALREEVSISPYDPNWPDLFEAEAKFLRATLPDILVKRIEHIGSTAVPSLAAKPIVDMLVEVTSFAETRKEIAPLLESLGYDYFWRTDVQVPYPWFIKRNRAGKRTHHIHMVEPDSKWWDRLYFRDYLRISSSDARRYEELKRNLADKYPHDRKAYTDRKSQFIVELTEKAKQHFLGSKE